MFHIKPAETVLYVAIALAICFIVFPEFFIDTLGDKIAPSVDRLAMSWLTERGVAFKEAKEKDG